MSIGFPDRNTYENNVREYASSLGIEIRSSDEGIGWWIDEKVLLPTIEEVHCFLTGIEYGRKNS